MAIILTACQNSGDSFVFGETGDTFNVPDWDPRPYYGQIVWGLLNAKGIWSLLRGEDWLAIETEDYVQLDKWHCKFGSGKILYRGQRADKLLKCFDYDKFDGHTIYHWQRLIGGVEHLVNQITDNPYDSQYAYNWAVNYGDEDLLIDRVVQDYETYYWGRNIGNRDVMIRRVRSPRLWKLWEQDERLNPIRFRELKYWRRFNKMLRKLVRANIYGTYSHKYYNAIVGNAFDKITLPLTRVLESMDVME